jgi:hypothetical protein
MRVTVGLGRTTQRCHPFALAADAQEGTRFAFASLGAALPPSVPRANTRGTESLAFNAAAAHRCCRVCTDPQ